MFMQYTIHNQLTRGKILLVVSAFLFISSGFLQGQTRIKDVTLIQGLASKQLTGPGLVSGLAGTGDGTQAIFTPQSIANYLRNFNITVDAGALRTRNSALVTVNATLLPFAKRGSMIDIIVSSIGDATSLAGGVLAPTILIDPETEQPVAIASGPISIGGLNVAGAATQNYTATGRIVNGGSILYDIESSFSSENQISLILHYPDFTTANRISQAINNRIGANTAEAVDPATVNVKIVQQSGQQASDVNAVEFVATIEQLSINTDVPAVVVINERTGTVVAGDNVTLLPVMISHGDISIQIRPPAGAPAGQAPQQGAAVYMDDQSVSTVSNLAAALNALQVTPRDLISIFQALKANGSLRATLKVL
jgi:flagellar P-ring protein precursor FlgI